MNLFYDRNGNLYNIEDEKVLTRKNCISVFNEIGEELELPIDKADEYKLTPDERLQVINELRARIAGLERVLGANPSIDPMNVAGNPNMPYTQPLTQPYSVPPPQPMPQSYNVPAYTIPTAPMQPYPGQTYTTPFIPGCGYPAINPYIPQPVGGSPYIPSPYGPNIFQPGTIR